MSENKSKNYMNKARFPMTSREGLSENEQRILDAVIYQSLEDKQELGEELTMFEKDYLAELKEKYKIAEAVDKSEENTEKPL
jgi:hypothetical protein